MFQDLQRFGHCWVSRAFSVVLCWLLFLLKLAVCRPADCDCEYGLRTIKIWSEGWPTVEMGCVVVDCNIRLCSFSAYAQGGSRECVFGGIGRCLDLAECWRPSRRWLSGAYRRCR
ncbi:hypothetical protein BR93DRAFT_33522 [Coniochaeta sp. PMI_546]|nr:hypothetical protein BR93DRAFT_33522 [Coniochaeta sp. PMI_546]